MKELLALSVSVWLTSGTLQTPYLWQDLDAIFQSGNTIDSALAGDVSYNTLNYGTEAGLAQDGTTSVGVFKCDTTSGKFFEAWLGNNAAFSYDAGYSIEVVAKIETLDTVFPGYLIGLLDTTDGTTQNVITFNQMTSQPHSSGEPANKFFADNQAGSGWQADTSYWTSVASTTQTSAVDTWYHIIVSQDASVTPNVVRVFVNGALYGVSYSAATAKTSGAQQPSLYLCGPSSGTVNVDTGIAAQIRGFGFYQLAITAEADALDTCNARAMSADCNGLAAASTDPTVSPSNNPTAPPSNNPTASPSNNPTSSPSKNPTVSPSNNPTSSPSNNPTASPSNHPTISPTTAVPSKSPTAPPSTNPSNNPTASPSNHPTASPSSNPSASPTIPDTNTVPCVFGSNYNLPGVPAVVEGDPHFHLWNGDRHDFMGAQAVNEVDVYYYMHPCKSTATKDMPFALAGHHWQPDWFVAESASLLDYVVLHLFDTNGDEYYVWLSSGSTGLHSYHLVDSSTSAVYDVNTNQADNTQLVSGVTASIGARFQITYTETTTSRIDVVLSIYACDVSFYMQGYADWWSIANGRDHAHALTITPPECYRCHTCGLLGSFKKSRAAHVLQTCGGGNYAYVAGASASNTMAWDLNAWTWRKDFVDSTATCSRTRRRMVRRLSRNLMANANCDPVTDDLCYVPTMPLNFAYNELCDSSVQSQVETACQTARDAQATNCALLGSLFCDELQAACDYDACVIVGTDTSIIDATVASFFDKVIDLTVSIPNAAANWASTNLGSVFVDTNTVDCVLGYNYNKVGTVCTAWGDPHFTTFVGDTHHLQGSNNLYYYLYPCSGTARQDMPFDLAAYHYTHGSTSTSVSTIYYVLLILHDSDDTAAGDTTDTYYVWLNPSFQKFRLADSTATGDWYYDSTATSLFSGVRTTIGNRFELTVTKSTNRIDVTLDIFECSLSFYMVGSGVGHDLFITPPQCYACHTCGLCGNLVWDATCDSCKRKHRLETCSGGNFEYNHAWGAWGTTYPKAHDVDGWSWSVDYVAKTATCLRSGTRRRRRMQDESDYNATIPANFSEVYVDPCDAAIFVQTETACQTARDRNSACCATVGSDACDTFQQSCGYDACVAVGSDASAIDATVLELFDGAIGLLCSIPDVATLLDPANIVTVEGAEPTAEPTPEPTTMMPTTVMPTMMEMSSTQSEAETTLEEAGASTTEEVDSVAEHCVYIVVYVVAAMMVFVF